MTKHTETEDICSKWVNNINIGYDKNSDHITTSLAAKNWSTEYAIAIMAGINPDYINKITYGTTKKFGVEARYASLPMPPTISDSGMLLASPFRTQHITVIEESLPDSILRLNVLPPELVKKTVALISEQFAKTAELLTLMLETWDSNSDRQTNQNKPSFYLAWAEEHDIEIPWKQWAIVMRLWEISSTNSKPVTQNTHFAQTSAHDFSGMTAYEKHITLIKEAISKLNLTADQVIHTKDLAELRKIKSKIRHQVVKLRHGVQLRYRDIPRFCVG